MTAPQVDVLVIGAGPAGTIAAAILQQEGYQVKIVERQQFPRFSIGESLLPRTLDNLAKANLLEAVQAAGFQQKNGAAFIRAREEYCNFNFSEQFTTGYGYAWQMKRGDFDQVLANEVQKRGVEIEFETSVTAVDIQADQAIVTVSNQQYSNREIRAKFIIDASGYGRVLPRLLNLDRPSNFPARSAFFAHVEDLNRPVETADLTEIIDLGKLWAWIIPVGKQHTSVGFVGDRAIMEQYGKDYSGEHFNRLLQAHFLLKERYQQANLVRDPQALHAYSVGVKQLYGSRFALVGNASEFLDPIFSSGVTFATESGARAAELVAQQLRHEPVDWETDYAAHMQHGLDVFRTYVKEWYTGNLQTIFFAGQKVVQFKQQICSVLAGYVWDKTNPYVYKHARAVPLLADVIKRQAAAKAPKQTPQTMP